MPTQSTPNGAMHYLEAGIGHPLVLLHAFPVDARIWKAQVDELSSRYRVIAPDFHGFGQSPAGGPFTVPSMAEDVWALLSAIGALPCVLGGVSMGGYVAMNFALKHAGDLHGLILVDTKDGADSPEARENRTRMIDVARTKGSATIAELLHANMLAPEAAQHRPLIVRALREMMEACPAETIALALEALRDRPDMTEQMGQIKTPTLVLVGECDVLTPPAVARAMAERLPLATVYEIDGAGHLPSLEQPTQMNRILRQFMDAMYVGPRCPAPGKEGGG